MSKVPTFRRDFLFSSLPCWLSFFGRSFGKGGFPDESSHFSSSSLSPVILKGQKCQSYLCAPISARVNLETGFDLLAQ